VAVRRVASCCPAGRCVTGAAWSIDVVGGASGHHVDHPHALADVEPTSPDRRRLCRLRAGKLRLISSPRPAPNAQIGSVVLNPWTVKSSGADFLIRLYTPFTDSAIFSFHYIAPWNIFGYERKLTTTIL